jgi:hypothetical protein
MQILEFTETWELSAWLQCDFAFVSCAEKKILVGQVFYVDVKCCEMTIWEKVMIIVKSLHFPQKMEYFV